MNEARRNLMVGLFVLFGLSAFAVLIVLFGKVPTWITSGASYALTIHFDSVSGVREGTLINMSGKTIGRVTDVEFVDSAHIERGIRVVASIEREYRLPSGARATTNEAILGMGRPAIQIIVDAPADTYIEVGASIRGRTTPAVETIFPPAVVDTLRTTATHIGEAAAALKPVLVDLHEIMQPREPGQVDQPGGPQGNLSTVAARLDMTLKHVDQTLGDPQVQSRFRDGIENLYKFSQDAQATAATFKEFANDARTVAADARGLAGQMGETVTRLDERTERIARALTDNLDRMSVVLDGLAVASLKISRGEGTLGRMVHDERLFESMVLTFDRLGVTVEEFKALVKEWQKGRIRVGL